MNPKSCLFSFFILSWSLSLYAQAPENNSERIADFLINRQGAQLTFGPIVPPLQQISGAPPAYYDYYWEFGDGQFSFEEEPSHQYSLPGEYEVQLLATGKYDNGRAPRRRTRRVTADTSVVVASTEPGPTALPDEWSDIGLKAVRSARPGEELVCILSYRNDLPVAQNGRILFFFNEKRYDAAHFTFAEARTHYGEQPEPPATGLSWRPLREDWSTDYWVSTSNDIHYQQVAIPAEDLIRDAQAKYRDVRSWHFQGMNPGEERNLFLSLDATPDMLKDTNAIITLEGIYLTEDGQSAETYTLELEIVASHDPNVMVVSDTRMGFRGVRRKDLSYKVRFQNDGEGPASRVEVTCDIPSGLNVEKVEILDYYPKCPVCPEETVTWSCLDTTLQEDKLIFTFRNIYLPGGRQDGVSDRDSTRGFIKYRLQTARGIKKRPMDSRASIVFDQNPPILTNRPKTRFKPGLSPGLIVARHFLDGTDQPSYNAVGVSISPFKPYRKYLQAELYAGLGRESNILLIPPADTISTVTDFIDPTAPFPAVIDSISRFRSEQDIQTFSIELVPVSLRYNLTDFVGIGAGPILQLDFSDITERSFQATSTQVYRCPQLDPNFPRERCEPIPELSSRSNREDSDQRKETNINVKLFADVQLGSVRRGPLVGLRGILPLAKDARAYYSVYLNFKL